LNVTVTDIFVYPQLYQLAKSVDFSKLCWPGRAQNRALPIPLNSITSLFPMPEARALSSSTPSTTMPFP
jgi:hypothetical protein